MLMLNVLQKFVIEKKYNSLGNCMITTIFLQKSNYPIIYMFQWSHINMQMRMNNEMLSETVVMTNHNCHGKISMPTIKKKICAHNN